MIRGAKRMAERVGFDPETGLLTEEAPKIQENINILEDSKLSTQKWKRRRE